MSDRHTTDPGKSVDSTLYSKAYFLYSFSGDHHAFMNEVRKRVSKASPQDPFVDELLAYAQVDTAGQRILDIGCGRGDLVRTLVQKGFNVTGIDYSHDAIALAQEAATCLPAPVRSNAVFVQGDAKTMSWDTLFDAVIMDDVVEHLYDWELVAVFKRAYLALKPGGRLVVFTKPNKNWIRFGFPLKRLFRLPVTLFKKWYMAPQHFPSAYEQGEYEKRSWRAIVKRPCGFFMKVLLYGEIIYQRDFFNYGPETHVNETTPRQLKRMLRTAFPQVRAWCADRSRNVLSMMTAPWWGPYVWAVATKPVNP